MSIASKKKRGRGRPPSFRKLIGVRMDKAAIKAIDRNRGKRSRPEMIRRLVNRALGIGG